MRVEIEPSESVTASLRKPLTEGDAGMLTGARRDLQLAAIFGVHLPSFRGIDWKASLGGGAGERRRAPLEVSLS
jgi:hypothetical protein